MMTNNEIDWIINWIKRNPKLVRFETKDNIYIKIKLYLSTTEMTLNDFKKLVRAVKDNKSKQPKYFTDKPFSDICYGTTYPGLITNVKNLFIDKSGEINIIVQTNELLKTFDSFTLHEFKHLWAFDAQELFHPKVVNPVHHTRKLISVSPRSSGKSFAAFTGQFNGGLHQGIKTIMEINDAIDKAFKSFVSSIGFAGCDFSALDSEKEEKPKYVDFDTMMKMGDDEL